MSTYTQQDDLQKIYNYAMHDYKNLLILITEI